MKLNIAYVIVLIAAITIPSAFADSITTEIDSTSYEIEYTGNNVIIKSVIADVSSDWQSLIFETEITGSEGDVSITFQRDFFDAKIGYSDDHFFILSDGDEIEFEEIKDDTSRTLSFSLSAGTEEIEIIGTILADNSFLEEQKEQEEQEVKDKEAAEKAAAAIDEVKKAAAEKAAAEKAAAEATAKAEQEAKLAEEQRLEKLMNSCGAGTIYENGECILSPMAKNATDMRTGPLIYSIVIAMSIGIILTLILWGIGKRSHKVLSDDDS